MTTLVAQLPVGLAMRVAMTADRLGLTHAELAIIALRLFVQAEGAEAAERTDGRTEQTACPV